MFGTRTILFCGEVVTVGLLDRCLKALPHVQFVNLYSISEAHDVACCDLSLWNKQEKVHVHNRQITRAHPLIYLSNLDWHDFIGNTCSSNLKCDPFLIGETRITTKLLDYLPNAVYMYMLHVLNLICQLVVLKFKFSTLHLRIRRTRSSAL